MCPKSDEDISQGRVQAGFGVQDSLRLTLVDDLAEASKTGLNFVVVELSLKTPCTGRKKCGILAIWVGGMISAWSRVTYSTRAPWKSKSLSFFLRVFSLDRSLFRARGQVLPSWTAEDFRGSLTMNLHSVRE